MLWIPESADIVSIHESLVFLFDHDGDPISPAGVKSEIMLESACMRPRTGMGNVEKYSTLEEKAAALFHSLVKNHAFHNGNKRTALVTLLTVLFRNDRLLSFELSDDEIYNMVLAVAADGFPTQDHGMDADGVVREITGWVRQRIQPRQMRPSAMKAQEFLSKCEQAGANTKVSGASYVVSYGARSIRFSRSTKSLDGTVVRQYLKRLRLTETATGVTVDEFQAGAGEEQDQIHRFISVLRRLALT